MTKNCIFHIPSYLDSNLHSGSQIRPLKMINAFKNIGYNVDIVEGYGRLRKEKISKIKNNIKKGIEYDFVYSESSTMPTLLTEKHHLPIYPFLDFNFLKFCNEKGIKVGLFYRDIHWAFSQYKNNVSLFKRIFSYLFYKYDLKKYKSVVDVFYLPSLLMYDYIPFKFSRKIEELPPAITKTKINIKLNMSKNKKLKIFYVGGIGDLYNLELLFNSVNKLEFTELTISCRKKEWIENKHRYEKYLNDRIKILHEYGENLLPYFKEADILNLFVEPQEYWKFAMPVKLFEYIGNKKPIISTKNTASSKFVEENDIGWSIEYSLDNLIKTLKNINNDRKQINDKIKNIENIIDDNTWEARAKKVASQLKQL